MTVSGDSVKRSTAGYQPARGGAVPTSPLHFRSGFVDDACSLVRRFHYSHRPPGSITFVGSFHLSGGLFGDCGDMVAACFFSTPPTRWSEQVIELTRLVRVDSLSVPLSKLISLCLKVLKKNGHDLIVSFADKTQGHEGYVYRASNWNYDGCRDRRMDGLLINGKFVPGRTCNATFGTRSPILLRKKRPELSIEPHYDEGKHLYWYALGKRGEDKASRLGLARNSWGV